MPMMDPKQRRRRIEGLYAWHVRIAHHLDCWAIRIIATKVVDGTWGVEQILKLGL